MDKFDGIKLIKAHKGWDMMENERLPYVGKVNALADVGVKYM